MFFGCAGPLVITLLSALLFPLQAQTSSKPFLGFDANTYPGDAALRALHQIFAFAGFWLNAPPGATEDEWTGKRSALRNAGFGFLVLFNGRLARELKSSDRATALGATDAAAAIADARREGFPPGTIIYLDQEEGGRMTPAQLAYILAWVDPIHVGGFRAGIYCSGMPAKEGKNESIVTAEDIRAHSGNRDLTYFVYNDACPPSPGCAYLKNPPRPAASGVTFASVWQFAQSPRRREFTRSCGATYNHDGNCYPPLALPASILLDLDSANSPDPSAGK